MSSGLVQPLRVLGRYALYEPIASGGMATVHLGRLLGPVGFARTVAIKRLHENFARDPEFVAMFMDEARLAGRIQHPNVVDVLDVIGEEGELFLVLNYVHGESLAMLLRTARERGASVPLGVVAAILVGVLHGLHAAHEAKDERGESLHIVHRDVSPHNILVGLDGVPRLLDFGIAKAAGRMQKSRSGQIKGKLAYMAPEQVTGESDCRTDVYAASIVLWEGLTGKRLFEGANEAMLLREVLLHRPIDPPSVHRPGIPPELDLLTLRGLDVEPSGRFSTAREMARELERIVPVASAAAVGEWLDGLMHASLVGRAKRVEIVEQSSSSLVDGKVLSPRSPPARGDAISGAFGGEITRSLPGAATGDGASDAEAATKATQMSITQSREPSGGRPRRRNVLVACVAAAAVGFASWASVQRSQPPLRAASIDATQIPPSASTVSSSLPPPVAPTLSASVDAAAPSFTVPARRVPSRPSSSPAQPRAGRDLQRAIDSRK